MKPQSLPLSLSLSRRCWRRTSAAAAAAARAAAAAARRGSDAAVTGAARRATQWATIREGEGDLAWIHFFVVSNSPFEGIHELNYFDHLNFSMNSIKLWP